MSLDALREALPAYAKDISLNLSTLASETTLSDHQKWGTFLASAYAVGEPTTVRAIEAEASNHLTPEARDAAKAAAAIMGMNNIYYRALHLMRNQEYRTLPAKLRMNVLGSPGAPKVDFELWSAAVSAINGCGGFASTPTKTNCANTTSPTSRCKPPSASPPSSTPRAASSPPKTPC